MSRFIMRNNTSIIKIDSSSIPESNSRHGPTSPAMSNPLLAKITLNLVVFAIITCAMSIFNHVSKVNSDYRVFAFISLLSN